MKIKEIGSNFYLSEREIDLIKEERLSKELPLWKNDSVVLTASGTLAIKLLLSTLSFDKPKVLLPNYLCDSIVDSFLEYGYDIEYYELVSDLLPNADSITSLINKSDYSVLFVCSLFGFDTSYELNDIIAQVKKRGTIVVEDITHSMFSSFKYTDANYYVCSLRKWFQLPDGGALIGTDIDSSDFYLTYQENNSIVENFQKASLLKEKYLSAGEFRLKPKFREYYIRVDEELEALKMTRMSDFSIKVLNNFSFNAMIEKRRANYKYLHEHLAMSNIVEIIFKKLPKDVVPLYMPIYVKNGKRNDFQKFMAEHGIYCTFHWPLPDSVKQKFGTDNLFIQNNILSLVVDQRYDLSDMERMVNCINMFE